MIQYTPQNKLLHSHHLFIFVTHANSGTECSVSLTSVIQKKAPVFTSANYSYPYKVRLKVRYVPLSL